MQTKRVLIVEDDPSVEMLLREGLSEAAREYQVESVSSGEAALKQLESARWDLIVTDNRMPGMSGLELLQAVRARVPGMLAILITAHGSDEVAQEAKRLQVYRYLTKPFPLADLLRVIHAAFALERGESEPSRENGRGANVALKVTLGGDGGVGKSTLIRRLCTGSFNAERRMTIGVDFHLYDVAYSDTQTRLVVWDVSGQDHFAFTRRAFYRGSKAIGLVYAVNDRATFERMTQWQREIREILPTTPLVLAANKTDLEDQVTREEGRALAREWNVPFFETSCATGEGVHDFFAALAQAAERNRRNK
ncbi:MAG: response regulator [Chloroflexi bacterium]|nr:response regulator [Chloroflexota bacterium]